MRWTHESWFGVSGLVFFLLLLQRAKNNSHLLPGIVTVGNSAYCSHVNRVQYWGRKATRNLDSSTWGCRPVGHRRFRNNVRFWNYKYAGLKSWFIIYLATFYIRARDFNPLWLNGIASCSACLRYSDLVEKMEDRHNELTLAIMYPERYGIKFYYKWLL